MTDPTYASSTNWTNGHGATLTVGGSEPGLIKSISGLGWTASKIDVTTHSSTSNIREYITGLVECGDISVVLRFDKAKASSNYTLIAANFQTKASCIVSFPFTTAETITFDALVGGLTIDTPDDDAVTMTLTLIPVSAPTFSS